MYQYTVEGTKLMCKSVPWKAQPKRVSIPRGKHTLNVY